LPERQTLVADGGRTPFQPSHGPNAPGRETTPNTSTFGAAAFGNLTRLRNETVSDAGPESGDGRPGQGSAGESFHGASLATDYTLLRFVAAGGQGEIWSATQGCLDREVAVKIVKTAQSGSALLNFIQEAHTSAELDHPNIVPVYDLSRCRVGESECHLMAMKLVRGTAWSKLLRRDRAAPDFTLEGHLAKHLPILVDVCNAVAYAHSKQIIHRDLKPSQVVVGDFGEVYLLDWGLALSLNEATPRLAGSHDAPKFPTRRTSTNQTGTPAYMAPEQTLESTEALGFHTDVYLAGACLHEIVTGDPPHRSDTLGDALTRAKNNETVDPPAACPPEVAAALRKSLATEIDERYVSILELRGALEDYMGGASRRRESREALAQARQRLAEASPEADYPAYVEADRLLSRSLNLWPGNAAAEELRQETLERFARAALEARDLKLAGSLAPGLANAERRSALVQSVDSAKRVRARAARQKRVLAGAAAFLAICAVAASWAFQQSRSLASEQTRLALLFKRVTELARREEELAAKLSIGAPMPKTLGLGKDDGAVEEPVASPAEMEQLLGRREELRRERHALALDPVAAPLLSAEPFELALGVANLALERARKADETLRAFELYGAARAARPDLPQALTGMGIAAARAGYLASATLYLGKAEELTAQTRGPKHPDRAEALALRAAALRELDDADPDYLLAYRESLEILEPAWAETALALSTRWRELGELDRAIAYATHGLEAIERSHGEESYEAAGARLSLARALDSRDRYDEAEENLRAALDALTKTKGERHPITMLAMDRLASTLANKGRYGEAEEFFRQSLALRQSVDRVDRVAVANSLNNLASLLFERGRQSEAEPMLLEALEINRSMLGDEHPNVAMGEYNLGQYYTQTGSYAEAERRLRLALDIAERRVGPDSPSVAACLNVLASLYRKLDRMEEAGAMLDRAMAIQVARLGPDHYQVGVVTENSAGLAYERGDYAEADRLFRRALEIWGKTVGPEHPRAGATMSNLANIARRQGRLEEAEELFLKALELHRKAFGEAHPRVAGIKQNLGVVYTAMKRYEEAEPLLRDAVESARATYGPNHVNTATMVTSLATLNVSMGRREEAEKLYKEAVAAFETTFGLDSPRVASPVGNLAKLYLGYPGRERLALAPALRALELRRKAVAKDEALAGVYMLAGEAALSRGHASAADVLLLRSLEVLLAIRENAEETSGDIVNKLLSSHSVLLHRVDDAPATELPTPPDLPLQTLKLAARREWQILNCGRLPIDSIAGNWGSLHDLASTPSLALDPPRRDIAARLAIRSAALLELAGDGADDSGYRAAFVAQRAAELGVEKEVADARQAARERLAELQLDDADWVEIARLIDFLDDVAGPRLDWAAEFPEVADWSLASLSPSGETLDRRVEEAIRLLAAEVEAEAAAEGEAVPAP
jgi:serine/threonine protein kinase/Tfp pilus assembly protein PilF